MAERWLLVDGFEGLYEVSDAGRVRSLDRMVASKNGSQKLSRGRVLKGRARENGGYVEVILRALPRPPVYALVHRLVLIAFVGPAPAGTEGRHDDGHRANNAVGNLLWSTHAENMQDQFKHGTKGASHWHPRAVLNEAEVSRIREGSESEVALSGALGVSVSTISRARRRITYALASRAEMRAAAA